MKKIIIIIIAMFMILCTNVSLLANNEIDSETQDNVVAMTEADTEIDAANDLQEISEQEEKAQERLVLILIIIGMFIALGSLYTLKYVAYKKENNK